MDAELEEFEFRARAEAESGRKRSPMQMIGRQIGLTARAALEGNPISAVGGIVGKAMGLDTSGALSRTLTRAGLPEPENTTERIVQAGAQGMAGAGGMTKLADIGGPAMAAFGKNPGMQVASGGAGAMAAQGTAELGGGPVAQTLAGLASAAAPGALGKKAGPTSIRNPANAVKLKTWTEANEAGYKFPPSAIERGMGRETIESIGGKAANKQEFDLHNQQITNKLAKQGAGLGPDEVITEETLARARYKMAEPYRQVAKLSPEANKALADWKDANAKATLHWRDYERNLTAAAKNEYDHWSSIADTKYQIMEGEAVKARNRELVDALREARVKIAQNYDVDKALNIGTGEVRANVLGKLLNKRGEKGMTGPLGIIAKTQQAFPQYLVEGAKTTTPGVSQMASVGLGSILGLEGYHSMGLQGGAGGLALGLAIPQVSRAARALSMSDIMQKPLRDQPGIPLSAVTSFLANERPADR